MKHDVDYLKDESYRLIGAAFEVYNDRGFGLSEEIYQECIEIELELRTIPFRAKQELACFYKGRELKKRFIPDLIAFASIVVELKAVSQSLPEHEAQVLNYMRITKQPLGYLINFGRAGGLDFKRIILSEFLPQ
jgi:GxxExxY protein